MLTDNFKPQFVHFSGHGSGDDGLVLEDEIKSNPTLKALVIGTLKSDGKEAFKEAVDNPVVNVLVAIIEGWIEGR